MLNNVEGRARRRLERESERRSRATSKRGGKYKGGKEHTTSVARDEVDLTIQRALLDLEKWESNLDARIRDEAESRLWETLNTPLSRKRLGGA